MTDMVININNLVVTYGSGAKQITAVNGISFQVDQGECVGFIGPNGAGKSTTIKVMMGFMFPAAGKVEVFGQPAGTVASRQRMGYLPEVALYYPFMKARELLELYGGLRGMTRVQLCQRIPSLLEEVGLGGRAETLLRNFSKGMQQRLGIAQSLISDPELLVFDELSSGLDPIGRHDLRLVLLNLKKRGRTIFFSSHDLTEVEDLCDRVVMIHQGQVIRSASVSELLDPLNRFEVVFRFASTTAQPTLPADWEVTTVSEGMLVRFEGASAYALGLKLLVDTGAQIIRAQTEQQSLEKYFMSLINSEASAPSAKD